MGELLAYTLVGVFSLLIANKAYERERGPIPIPIQVLWFAFWPVMWGAVVALLIYTAVEDWR